MARLNREASESAASVEEDEDDGRAGQGDQGQSGKIRDQVEIDAHEQPSESSYTFEC